MKRGKTRVYLVLAVLLVLAAILLPFIVNLASDAMVKNILKKRDAGIETETESECIDEIFTEAETDSAKEMAVISAANAKSQEESGAASGTAEERTEKETVKMSEAAADQKISEQENYTRELQQYVRDFQPENIFYINMAKEDKKFLKEREPEFLKALAEYIYSMYGDQISVSKVVILGEIGSDNFEYAFYFTVETDDGESEAFYCVYNKEQDFFSLYSMMMG